MKNNVKIENVSKAFGENKILNQIDLDIPEGSIYGLIGPSGAGKTTLIKMIVGMDRPDEGVIVVLNEKVPSLSVLKEIGYMAQADALYTQLTGKENLSFFGGMFKLGKKELRDRIEYTASLVNLTDALDQKVSTYSGGMKRRLSLAIALIQNPKICILDEPTVGIDPALRVDIWNELLRLKNEEGKTIIITTHVMDEAERCDHIALLREGRVLTSGSPEQLKREFHADNLHDVFLHAGRSKG